jgi:hypothetical protein
LRVFQETIEFHGKLQQDGKIDGFDAHLIAPHGGDLAGFILLRGEREALDDVRNSEDFERLIARAASVVDQVGVLNAYSGEALGQAMGRFQGRASDSPSIRLGGLPPVSWRGFRLRGLPSRCCLCV